MSERLNGREYHLRNPLRLLRALADLALMPVQKADENLYTWPNAEHYPPITNVEAPAATEEELL